MVTHLIGTIPDGPLDIVGDVHGESDALLRLLDRLGCDPERGTAERPLVFVGDLIDRGPDSPGVVETVMRLVEAGIGHCILGNHELNVLRGQRKEGNGWWYGDASDSHQYQDGTHTHEEPFSCVLATAVQQARYRRFFETLPLALVRADLRVVHACWDPASIEALPASGDVGSLTGTYQTAIDVDLEAQGLIAEARRERAEFAELVDLAVKPTRQLHAHPTVGLARQNDNPIKVLTSGLEAARAPDNIQFLSGKWRHVARVQWWDTYAESAAVVVGHYWRRRDGAKIAGKPAPWDTAKDTDWTGPRGNVFCVDYSVGRRFLERAKGKRSAFAGGLAALRWPERTLVFDDLDPSRPTTNWGPPTE